jgi:hypothetical protein
MQVIEAKPLGRQGTSRLALVFTIVGAVVLLGAGVAVGWVAVTSSFVTDVSQLGRDRVARPIIGTITFALAFLVPGFMVIFGVSRLVDAIDRGGGRKRRPVAALAGRLTDEYVVAQAVRLPDGPMLPEVVVGPHGMVVVESLPPARVMRTHGRTWEVRLTNGKWMAIENPLDRAARDAERLRHWVANQDESFSPRVYAAVVADGHELARTPEVAVVEREQLPTYLTGLPAARQMTPDRRMAIVDMLRAAV